MVINNHTYMDIRKLLDLKLLSQPFGASLPGDLQLDDGRLIAQLYTRLENCISVLSDMKTRKSYIYYGAVADQIGLSERDEVINSIWEDKLLKLVQQEDLRKKYQLEFKYFQLLNSIDVTERVNYRVVTKLRIKDAEGGYLVLQHRLVYISSSSDGSVWLALCLYNLMPDHPRYSIPEGVIINSRTGSAVDLYKYELNTVLTSREKEILRLIKNGHRSKEISSKLSLSINTVNRHRQNIFQKLNVTNAMEACRVAEAAVLF
jgi:DNA-binding CsgD family transcriptional regulator